MSKRDKSKDKKKQKKKPKKQGIYSFKLIYLESSQESGDNEEEDEEERKAEEEDKKQREEAIDLGGKHKYVDKTPTFYGKVVRLTIRSSIAKANRQIRKK